MPSPVRGWRKEKARAKVEKERKRADEKEASQQRRAAKELTKQREEAKRQRIESLLRRDAVNDKINCMGGPEFKRFMADLCRQKGYDLKETKATGDQGIDLLLDMGGERMAVKLKRWTGPVANAVVGTTFAGKHNRFCSFTLFIA